MKRIVLMSALMGAGLLIGGCVNVGQENLKISTYMLSVERDLPAADTPMGEDLFIERVTAMAPYNSRTFTVRTSETEFGSTYYDELLISPSENLQAIFYQWFAESALFNSVSVSKSLKGLYLMDLSLLQLLLDESNPTAPQAVLELKVTLRDPDGHNLLSQTYHRRLDLPSREIVHAVAAWSEGLYEILCEIERSLISAMRSKD